MPRISFSYVKVAKLSKDGRSPHLAHRFIERGPVLYAFSDPLQ
jgi:hypothetical protein